MRGHKDPSTQSRTGNTNTIKTTSSVHDVNSEKPPFGSRFLTDESDVWNHNAWDHVPPPADQVDTIAATLERQRLAPVHEEDKSKYNDKPARHWDNFYKANSSNFFRNRKWLCNEFPDLAAALESDAGPKLIVEIGCGAGNSVLPLLAANCNPELTIRAYDYSNHAIKLVQTDPLYSSSTTGTIHASVWDATSPNALPDGLEPLSADIVVLIFVLSALHPDEWEQTVLNVHKILKPGGVVLFRDYGRYDLTQLRFKAGRYLDDNFYIRGDKTRVYFFEPDELAVLFTGFPISGSVNNISSQPEAHQQTETGISFGKSTTSDTPALHTSSIHPRLFQLTRIPHPLFTIEQLGVDRRLLVNRKRQLRMYRVWVQGKFGKLGVEPAQQSYSKYRSLTYNNRQELEREVQDPKL